MANEQSPLGNPTSLQTADRHAGTSTLPPPVRTPHDPTREEAEGANSPGGILTKTEKAILEFTKRHPLVTAGSALAAVVTGLAAVETAQGNIPGVHRSVENSSFDNTAQQQEFTDKNTFYVTLDQFKTMNTPSSYDPITQTFTSVFDYAVPEGVNVEYKKILHIETSGRPVGPDTPFYHKEINFLDQDGKPAAGVGVMVGEDGWHVRLSQGWADFGEDPNSAGGVQLFKYFPKYDVTVWKLITDPSVSLQPHMSMVDTRKQKVVDYENELPSRQKGSIVATTTDKTQKALIQEDRFYQGKNIKHGDRKLMQNVDPNLLTEIAGQVLLVRNK